MNVDIVDVTRLHVGILQSIFHRKDCTQPFGMGGCEVVGIGRHTATGNLGINFCAACQSMLQFFENQHYRTFADNESVAALAEGTRSCFGRIITG